MEGLVGKQLREESTNKGIAGTVGVHNVIGVDDEDGVLVHLALMHHNGWVLALRNNHRSLLLGVDLKQSNVWQVMTLTLGSCEILSAISFTSVVSHLLDLANAAASVSLPKI
jgi:hypothetical protein